jgi:hypothetical protein
MFVRVLACALAIVATSFLCAQDSFNSTLLSANDDHVPVGRRAEPTVEIPTDGGQLAKQLAPSEINPVGAESSNDVTSTPEDKTSATPTAQPAAAPASAWLDLRQTAITSSAAQSAPDWVKSVTTAPLNGDNGTAPKTLYHIELAHPPGDYSNLLFRLLFEDKSDARPELIARDDSGAEISHSGELGSGIDLPSSESVVIPMQGVAAIDIAVAGDGKTVRAAYLDWMKSNETVQPVNAEDRPVIAETFAAMPPLDAPEQDAEKFGTVTATLAAEAVHLGPQLDGGATFQFGIERQPLLALLTFEVASPQIDAPPEIYLNGQNIGPATLMLPELSDPAYRGEMEALVSQMHFRYTGWLRAQKIVPVTDLKAGDNQLIIASGAGTAASAVRATQIQLKYLWEKSDYILRPTR